MSRLVIPVRGQILYATGDIRLWVDLYLDVKDNAGNWAQQRFRVDSATDVSTFPAFEAKQRNFPFPQSAARRATHTQTGLEIRSGYLRSRFVGLNQTEYPIPCLFLGHPDTPPTGNVANFPRNLLQPLALLEWFRITFEKNATVAAPYGEMILETK